MSGLVRTAGPPPKRSAERVRRNEETIPTKTIDVSKLISKEVTIPEANADWHPAARHWYESLAESAQCVYYEPSDWALALIIAESISRDLRPQVIAYDMEKHKVIKKIVPIKGSAMSAYLKGMTALLVTETDRLKASIEINRAIHEADPESPEGVEGGVVLDFQAYQDKMAGNIPA